MVWASGVFKAPQAIVMCSQCGKHCSGFHLGSCGIFIGKPFNMEFFPSLSNFPKWTSKRAFPAVRLFYVSLWSLLTLILANSTTFSRRVVKTHEMNIEMGLEGLVINREIQTIKLLSTFLLKKRHLYPLIEAKDKQSK